MRLISVSDSDKLRIIRNLHPHKEAVAAMHIWGERYAAQRGGAMDFYDTLTDGEKRVCRDLVRKIEGAPDAPTNRTGR